MMGKTFCMMLIAGLLSACSTDAIFDPARNGFEQRELAERVTRQRADAAVRQARLLKEQEDLKRQLDEKKRREAMAASPQTNPFSPAGIDGTLLRDGTVPLQTPAEETGHTIYYDYDAYAVKPEYQPILEAQVAQLTAHPDSQLRVEGNCDERGSREYNLALGQRRADAVKRALMLLGAPAAQIVSVSFGSENPAAEGHSESDLALNRRSDMMYAGRGPSK